MLPNVRWFLHRSPDHRDRRDWKIDRTVASVHESVPRAIIEAAAEEKTKHHVIFARYSKGAFTSPVNYDSAKIRYFHGLNGRNSQRIKSVLFNFEPPKTEHQSRFASNAKRNAGVSLKISSSSHMDLCRDARLDKPLVLLEAKTRQPSLSSDCSALSSALLSFSSLVRRRHRSLVSVSPTSVCPRRNERKLEARKKRERAWERRRLWLAFVVLHERACFNLRAILYPNK